ncbi:MAG: alpha-ketoglutarate-dependent dioxygenase AlkB [Acidimicrobiia bacterium]|nr:alpha-ketoglutarate-dependent dioxygenase AlkB [Acidimicrobiia bacterium]
MTTQAPLGPPRHRPSRTAWQPVLVPAGSAGPSPPCPLRPRRTRVAERSWVDVQAAWLDGADALFELLVERVPWQRYRRPMYERIVDEPRLVHHQPLDASLPDPRLAVLAAVLGAHYGVRFTTVGFNLYRDGRDSVAWHGDRVARRGGESVVAIVSLGEPRPFRLRRRGGRPGWTWRPGHGDLLVMGGACQFECEHAVPKVAVARPRLSVMFRHEPAGRARDERPGWAVAP